MAYRWVVADTETTGVAVSDRVVEVAWCEIDDGFNVLAQGSSLINPGIPIPAGASAVHGIRDRDVRDAPTMEQYFGDTLGNRFGHGDIVLIAHNAAFDARYLAPYFPEDFQRLCTLRLARKVYPDADNHKLATLKFYLDLCADETDRFHSADGDTDVLLALLGKLHEDTGMELDELLHFCVQPIEVSKMPFGKHRNTPLKDLPRSYVSWLLGLPDLDSDLRESLRAL